MLHYAVAVPPVTSLRQRHTERTRQALVDASLELFAERGFVATTIEDIAARADVAPRTFFRYFGTKEAVLYHDASSVLERLIALIEQEATDEAPSARLIRACIAAGEEFSRDQGRMRLITRLSSEEPTLVDYHRLLLMQQYERRVVEALGAQFGIDPSDLALRTTTAALLSSLGVAFRAWIDAGATGAFRPYITEAMEACRHAFAEPPLTATS